MKKYKVLFCDLDGTLIETASGKTFPEGIWDMKFKFDVLDAIKNLAPEYVFIVSNQGGIELGYVDGFHMSNKCNYVCAAIEEYCKVAETYYDFCRTNAKDDPRRKPNTGMLEYFQNVCDFNKEDCLMIGDASGLEGQFSDSDKKTAENFGIDYMDVSKFIEKYGKVQEETSSN